MNDLEQLSEQIIEMIARQVRGDHDGAFEMLRQIGAASDAKRMFTALCGMAGMAAEAMREARVWAEADARAAGVEIPEGVEPMWTFVADPDADDCPHDRFAVRFILAYINDDIDTAVALFNVSVEAGMEDHVQSVTSLLAYVAQTVGAQAMARKMRNAW